MKKECASCGVVWLNTDLSKKYLFENFKLNKHNQDIYNNAIDFLDNIHNEKENTFGIYGTLNSGKTHFTQAMGNYLQQKSQNVKVTYNSMFEFTKQSINSMRDANTDQMIDFYTNADVLILDDIDFIETKYRSQEILLTIIDFLLRLDRKIIFTSNKPLADIKELDVRITNRLTKGSNLHLKNQ
jgi:chromosomal replication initiator protein